MPRTRHGAPALLICLLVAGPASSQETPASAALSPTVASADMDMTTLTAFFRHDGSLTLDEINARLKEQGFT